MTLNKTNFRLLIVAEILLTIGGVIASFLGEASLPEALRTFESTRYEAETVPMLLVSFGLFILILICLLIAWVGLLLFWRPARPLYLLSMAAGLFLMPFLGPFVDTGLSYALAEAVNIIGGIILALVYFSPLKELFERTKAPINS
jgi:hypothetical protein